MAKARTAITNGNGNGHFPSTEAQAETLQLLKQRAALVRKEQARRGKFPAGYLALRDASRGRGRPRLQAWPALQLLAYTYAKALGRMEVNPDVELLTRAGKYWAITGPAPLLGPGDVPAARAFLHKLESARAMGGWGDSDRVMLCRLIKRWGQRASGEDARFQTHGTAPGRFGAQKGMGGEA